MQNREELRQKGHDGSRKTTCRERGEKYHFQKGGGGNIVFGPKYRPLKESASATTSDKRVADPQRTKAAATYLAEAANSGKSQYTIRGSFYVYAKMQLSC